MIECTQVQAALSARLDGEPVGLDDDVIDAHVSGCQQCATFLERAALLNRSLSINSQPAAIPDLSDAILSTVEPEFRRQAASRAAWVMAARALLVVVGVLFVWFGVRTFAGSIGVEDPQTQALALDAAAVRMTLAFGALFAAWRPGAMGYLMPMYGALFAFSVGLRVRDVLLGTITVGEVTFIALVGVAAVALVVGWMANSGAVAIRQMWQTLSATPRG
ncbi:zf-HC2 domain-containing protein [Corynebacterium aquilae]|uniref:Putative zinc-finger domain-containing protein n=1 Tax=Corynebacterium aquilae DSM 44791 TaxID=1431546 RepID=A0A1L7CEU0_9CORY|nr:zf-HC2 domain-containing protein [Corynebacterium aquilae]APT84356.1 hypothetical protein CAQU_03915 [Corynebacterium aquilae DSM 44791]